MNGDEAVQKTNDDAQQSKAACAVKGYFQDDFVKYFVRKQGPFRPWYTMYTGARQGCDIANVCVQHPGRPS